MDSEDLQEDAPLNDCEYVKQGFRLWICNEPTQAIDFLNKRKDSSLNVDYARSLLHVFNALISFDRNKIAEASLLMKDLERKCTPDQGWLKSIKTKLFGDSQPTTRKFILSSIEKEIILGDSLLCSAILVGIPCDVASILKSALILRRAWKIYHSTFKEIHNLCNQFFDGSSPIELGSIDLNIFNNNDDVSSPTSSVWSVPSLSQNRNENVPSNGLIKSQSTIFATSQKASRLKNLTQQTATMINTTNDDEDSTTCDDISNSEYKIELARLKGAIYFGYGLLQIAFSFLPPQLKLINFLGYQGDREMGLKCLKESRNSHDSRSYMATIALLWYYLIIVPFFSMENSDLSEELSEATQILNENEQFDQSSLFLFFSGRRQRLKKKIKYSILHYDAALRVPKLPRELKILLMHELGMCLLIELNFQDSMHYFNELKVSKFSRSYYMYLTAITRGSLNGTDEKLVSIKGEIQQAISTSSQKDGIIERFLQNRCDHALPENDVKNVIYWRLLCYEIMYLWNLLGSSSHLATIIEECKIVDTEPIMGLALFLMGACNALLCNYDAAILCYRQCIEKCNTSPIEELQLHYIPAYANFELANILIKHSMENSKIEAHELLLKAQQYRNYDFEHRLKLRIFGLQSQTEK